MTTWISFYNLLMDIQKSCMDKRVSVRTTKVEKQEQEISEISKFPDISRQFM